MRIYELLARDKCRYTLPEQYWYLEVRGKLFCKYCSTVFRGFYPKPIDVRLRQLYKNVTYESVFTASVGIIREDLLAVLAPYLEGYVFGQCFNEKGRLLSKYRTMYHWRYISIRDAQEPSSWVCKDCGVMVNCQLEAPYALSAELAGAHIWQDVFCRLYVDEHVAQSIDWKPFKDFELYPIPVRDRIVEPETSDEMERPAAGERSSRRGESPKQPVVSPPAVVAVPTGQLRDRTPLGTPLRKKLRDRGLNAEEVTFLMGLARVGFKLEPASSIIQPLSEVPLGASRLGGLPDMPSDLEWPRSSDGRPLAFLAQLNLVDAREVRLETPLPEAGQMYFFYDAQEQPWGLKPSEQGQWRVLLSEAKAEDLRRTEPPAELPEEYRFDVRAIRLEPTLFLPSAETLWDAEAAGSIPGGGALQEALSSGSYAEWVSKIHGLTEGEMDHRFLGHPQEVQSAMPGRLPPVEYTQETLGATASAEPSPSETEHMPASEWRLLLQLDSIGGPGWMWGDSGRLYFWIPRKELEARRFGSVWGKLQSA